MLNKLIVALCALGLSFAVACSSGGDTTPDENIAETTVEETEAVEETEVAEEAAPAEEEAEVAEADEAAEGDDQELAGDEDYDGEDL